jgi:uncharacterized protein YukE
MTAKQPPAGGGELRTDFASLDYPTMRAMLDRGDPRTISATASAWEQAGTGIAGLLTEFETGVAALRDRWHGVAADAYIAKVNGLGRCLRAASDACYGTRNALAAAAEALTAAKQQMPAPPAAAPDGSSGSGGPPGAAAVMRTLSDRYLTAQAAIPATPAYSGPPAPDSAGEAAGPEQDSAGQAAGRGSAAGTTDAPGGAPSTEPGAGPAPAPGPAAAADLAGTSPPGAVLPGAAGDGTGAPGGAAGLPGNGTGMPVTSGAGSAAPGTTVPGGWPLMALGGAAVLGAAAGGVAVSRSGRLSASSLFADEQGASSAGLPAGGVIGTAPTLAADPLPPMGHGMALDGGSPAIPADGAPVFPLSPGMAGSPATETYHTTWLVETEDVWGAGPAAPPVLGQDERTIPLPTSEER